MQKSWLVWSQKLRSMPKMQFAFVRFQGHMPTFWTLYYLEHIHYIQSSNWTRCMRKYFVILLFLEIAAMSAMRTCYHVSVLTSPFKDTNVHFFASAYIFSVWSAFDPKNEWFCLKKCCFLQRLTTFVTFWNE